MHGLLEAFNRHATAVGMRINASKTKMMPAFIPREQCHAVLLDGEPLDGVNGFKYITEKVRSKYDLARSAFSSPQSCLWSRREISLHTKGRVYEAVVRSILLYGARHGLYE